MRPSESEPATLISPAFRLEAVEVAFGRSGPSRRSALTIDRLEIQRGRSTGVRGPSGAGKSTLLAALAGLLAPITGRIFADDVDLSRLTPRRLERWRRTKVGLIFQDFHLVDELSLVENVLLPLRFDRFRIDDAERERAVGLLARLGLADVARRVGRLSRGERQRVAVARALVRSPEVVLADEPTASLDPESATLVADLLIDHVRDSGACVVIASHDAEVLARTDATLQLIDGHLVAEGRS